MFAADNGGCAEFLAEDSNQPNPNQFNNPGPDGKEVNFGNIPNLRPGPSDTFMSYDLPWANLSNTPFRLFKRWVHEGGISTPFIVHWPERITNHDIINEPVQFADISPTILDLCESKYLSTHNGNEIIPVEGESFASLLKGKNFSKEKPLCWEHEGNRAVRVGDWKLVSEFPGPWELYNISEDRSETNNLVNKEKEIASDLEKKYLDWAKRCGVLDWPIRVNEESTKKIYSMNKNEVGLDPNITPIEIENDRRYKRKPPNKETITIRGMRYSK